MIPFLLAAHLIIAVAMLILIYLDEFKWNKNRNEVTLSDAILSLIASLMPGINLLVCIAILYENDLVPDPVIFRKR